MATIKILHVINQLGSPAGAETSLRQIIGRTHGAELQHAVAVLRAGEAAPPELAARGVAVLSPKAALRGRLAMVRHVVHAIRATAPDLVHTTLFDSDLAGRVAAYWTGVPVLTSLVNTAYGAEAAQAEPVPAAKLRLVRMVDGILARHATTAFHAISRAAADHAVEHLGVPREIIRIVPRGRSAEMLGERSAERRSRVRQSLRWGSRPVVINVARQEPQKGHVQLAEAMSLVVRRYPAALLVLVGREGRSTPALRQRIAQLGIAASVMDLGVRDDVPDLLAAADVFAFSSLYEGLGGAVIEAAGLGTPVVSYDVPAVREILGENHPWLTPVGDVPALARNIIEGLDGGPKVRAVGAALRARFLESYEMDACIRDMTSLYADLAAGAAGPRRRRLGRVRTAMVGSPSRMEQERRLP